MNYYELHIGDYLKDTARLTLIEHGVYGLLLADYYGNESPLPADFEQLYRIARAMGKQEQSAVRCIAEAFFPIGNDGLRHNKRADEELEKAAHRMEGAEGRKANERERQKRARERRKALFDQLRDVGVTPKFDATTQHLEELVTQHVTGKVTPPVTAPVTPNVTRDITANQTPHAIHQKEKIKIKPSCSAGAERFEEFWSKYPRKVGKANALKAWIRLAPDTETVKAILAALRVQCASVQWQRDDGRFIPHAATWLNGRRWEDELLGIPESDHGHGVPDYLAGAI